MKPRLALILATLLTLPFGGVAGGTTSSDLDLPDGVWLAGDLHVHTSYSHDAWGPPEDNPLDWDPTDPQPQDWFDGVETFGWTVAEQIQIAEARGLDYVALTDHNDVRSAHDPGWESDHLVLVPGYEASLRGHAQILGTRYCYDENGETTLVESCPRGYQNDAALVTQVADHLRAAGGVFQANHPAYRMTAVRPDVESTAGWDWRYGFDVVPDTVEVWNIGWPWQPPAPSANSNDDAVRYWEGWLNRGERVAATGGSDNHWRSTVAVQGVGQPTTWVYATDRSLQGVLDGLRAGRTTISHQPPTHGGPVAYLEADASGDGRFDTMVGGDAPAGATARVRIDNPVPGSWLRIITNLGDEMVPVVNPLAPHTFTIPNGAIWVRAEIFAEDALDARMTHCEPDFAGQTSYCRNRLVMLALTSAIYVTA